MTDKGCIINLIKLIKNNSEYAFSTLLLTITIPIANNAVGTAAPDKIFNVSYGIFPKLISWYDNNRPTTQEMITGFFNIDLKAFIRFKKLEELLKLVEKMATKVKTIAISKTKINEAGRIASPPKSNMTKGTPI